MHAPAGGERRMTHDTQCAVVGAGGASRDRTGDLLVANQTLSQLSYGPLGLICLGDLKKAVRSNPRTAGAARFNAVDPHVDMVGLGGVEPPTSPLSGVRSNQLSYRPLSHLKGPASGCPRGHQLRLEQVTCDGGSRQTTLVLS